jgi:hypothetical protein
MRRISASRLGTVQRILVEGPARKNITSNWLVFLARPR